MLFVFTIYKQIFFALLPMKANQRDFLTGFQYKIVCFHQSSAWYHWYTPGPFGHWARPAEGVQEHCYKNKNQKRFKW